jgi:hypothetical protein
MQMVTDESLIELLDVPMVLLTSFLFAGGRYDEPLSEHVLQAVQRQRLGTNAVASQVAKLFSANFINLLPAVLDDAAPERRLTSAATAIARLTPDDRTQIVWALVWPAAEGARVRLQNLTELEAAGLRIRYRSILKEACRLLDADEEIAGYLEDVLNGDYTSQTVPDFED